MTRLIRAGDAPRARSHQTSRERQGRHTQKAAARHEVDSGRTTCRKLAVLGDILAWESPFGESLTLSLLHHRDEGSQKSRRRHRGAAAVRALMAASGPLSKKTQRAKIDQLRRDRDTLPERKSIMNSCFLPACLPRRRPPPRRSPSGWSVRRLWSRSIAALATGRLLTRNRGSAGPPTGTSRAGTAKGLEGGFDKVTSASGSVQLTRKNGNTVTFAIVDDDRSLQISYGGKDLGDIRLLGDCSIMTDREAAAVIVPCREGLLIPADSGVAFQHGFGSSEYEGCHMNMLGLDQERQYAPGHLGRCQCLARGPQQVDQRQAAPPGAAAPSSCSSRRLASVRLTPLGPGRLEHARRRLSPDRPAEGSGRHAPSEDRPRSTCRTASWRGQREALDLPGTADERGQHAGRAGQGPLDVR